MRKLGEHLDLPQISRANSVKWHITYNKRKNQAAKYAYAYTHAHTYELILVRTHTYAHALASPPKKDRCAYAYTKTYTHVYIWRHTHAYAHAQASPKKNMQSSIYIHMHTCHLYSEEDVQLYHTSVRTLRVSNDCNNHCIVKIRQFFFTITR